MANRYWVGGSGTWDSSTTTHWSATSGGSGGVSVPISTDNVFFDSNSNGGAGSFSVGLIGDTFGNNITISPAVPLTITANGYSFNIYGNFSVSASNVTFANTTGAFIFRATSGNISINTNGVDLKFGMSITNTVSSTAIFTLASNLNFSSGGIDLSSGIGGFTLNTAGFSVTGVAFNCQVPATINLGTSTITLSDSTAPWYVTSGTFSASNSTIVLSNNIASINRGFSGNGIVYGTLVIGGATSSSTTTIYGANTFNTISSTKTVAHIVTLAANQDVTNWTITGTAGNVVTLNSTSAGVQRTLHKLGGGPIILNYLSIRDSNATPTATWYAGHTSTNVSNNTGWIFGDYFSSSISEGITSSDTYNALVTYFGSVIEAIISDTDSEAVVATFIASIIEVFSSSETLVANISTSSNITETIVANDSDIATQTFVVQAIEAQNIADLSYVAAAFKGSLFEGITTNDIIISVSAKFITYITESLNTADIPTSIASFVNINVVEGVNIADIDQVKSTFSKSIVEPVSVTDSTTCFGFGTIDNTQNTVWVQVDNRQ